MKTKRNAFTLIELLVVVAIIAVLIAILLPGLREARGQARKAVCGSNLRQVGIGIYNYWTEWNGRVPHIVSPMTNAAFGDPARTEAEVDPFDRELWPESLPNVLMPRHMGEVREVFVCPSANNGWPRNVDDVRYAYRPSSSNQPSGSIRPLGSYERETFGFMDGRMMRRFRMDLHVDPSSPQEIIDNAIELAKSRASYVRDLVKTRRPGVDPVIGPHKGGILMLNRDLQVEYRGPQAIAEDLAPNGGGVQF